MSFVISGLDPAPFAALRGLSDGALAARNARRVIADMRPGYPCRITLEDAEPGETLLLLNHESHSVPTPYRSAYAIYVRERARAAATYADALPPVMENRPIALRHFSEDGMLIGASMGREAAETRAAILAAFDNARCAYIHAHNAMHGCFAAEVRRAL